MLWGGKERSPGDQSKGGGGIKGLAIKVGAYKHAEQGPSMTTEKEEPKGFLGGRTRGGGVSKLTPTVQTRKGGLNPGSNLLANSEKRPQTTQTEAGEPGGTHNTN